MKNIAIAINGSGEVENDGLLYNNQFNQTTGTSPVAG